jgi:hypothetical protein
VQVLDPTGATSSGLGTLDIQVVVDSVDADAASLMGWGAGVPAASVRWTRVDQDRFQWQGATADSSGRVEVTAVPPGQYWVTAERDVSGPMTASLPHGTGSPRTFAGGIQLELSAGATRQGVLPVRLDRADGLVLSELYLTDPFPYGQSAFWQSKYIEIYNNSDQTQYLDGLLIGNGYIYLADYSHFGHHSCAETEAFRTGSRVWSVSFWQMPGSGHDYPLAPGRTALLAVSAADHTSVLGGLPDLRSADFEFVPPGTADNPGVPNIDYLGPWFPPQSNLFNGFSARGGWFLARPLELSDLPRKVDPYFTQGTPYLGVPVEDIVDYVAITEDPTTAYVPNRGTTPYCDPTEPSAVDHLIAEILAPDNGDLITSGQRRVLRVVDGHAVLMDTNTSPVDWVNIPRTPGGLPPGGSP